MLAPAEGPALDNSTLRRLASCSSSSAAGAAGALLVLRLVLAPLPSSSLPGPSVCGNTIDAGVVAWVLWLALLLLRAPSVAVKAVEEEEVAVAVPVAVPVAVAVGAAERLLGATAVEDDVMRADEVAAAVEDLGKWEVKATAIVAAAAAGTLMIQSLIHKQRNRHNNCHNTHNNRNSRSRRKTRKIVKRVR